MTIYSFIKKTFNTWNTPTALAITGNPSVRAVNEQNALTLATVWACVRLISESIASLPCGVFERDAEGDKIPVENEISRILQKSPNADMSPFNYMQAVMAQKLLWGNSYSLKHYRGSGANKKLVSLELLRPDLMSIRDNKDGSFAYLYSDPWGQKEYSEDEILHVKGFSLDGRIGLSVIAYARLTLGNSMAMEESMTQLYLNGMRPGGALSTDHILKADQRTQIRESVAEQVAGVSKTGGLIVLEAGMKYQAFTMPPADLQTLESRAFSVEEICRWFGVPPSLIGHTEKTTSWGTGLEQINIGFLTYTLTPHIKNTEQEFWRSLFSATERLKQFAEFNVEGFMRADSKGRAALYSSATQNGWMTRAEVRRKENLPYKEGSDELTVQSAQINLDDLEKLHNNAVDNPEPEQESV